MIRRKRLTNGIDSFSLSLDVDWFTKVISTDEEALCIDGARFSNVARFVNHKCEGANLVDMPV